MDITITINTDNDAFGDDPTDEIRRILRVISDRMLKEIVEPGANWKVFDVNGNSVGKVGVE